MAFVCIALKALPFFILFSLITTALAEEDIQILFVETGESRQISSLDVNVVKMAIYSPIQQSVVVTIYVQDSEMAPLGVLIFKTTLLAGETPIEYGFSVPIECHYDSRVHEPVCNNDSPRTIYVNVFKDLTLTMPLTAEFSEVLA